MADNSLAVDLLNAVGIDPSDVTNLVLECRVGGPPTLTVTHRILHHDECLFIPRKYEVKAIES